MMVFCVNLRNVKRFNIAYEVGKGLSEEELVKKLESEMIPIKIVDNFDEMLPLYICNKDVGRLYVNYMNNTIPIKNMDKIEKELEYIKTRLLKLEDIYYLMKNEVNYETFKEEMFIKGCNDTFNQTIHGMFNDIENIVSILHEGEDIDKKEV